MAVFRIHSRTVAQHFKRKSISGADCLIRTEHTVAGLGILRVFIKILFIINGFIVAYLFCNQVMYFLHLLRS